MNIGFIGTGKLGLPISLMYNCLGHNLLCYDVNQIFYKENNPIDLLYDEELCPNNKIKLKDWLKTNNLNFINYKHTDLESVIKNSDIIFVSVQTPHELEYEGINRLQSEKKDFNYNYLIDAFKNISVITEQLNKKSIVIIISTVLPGTIRRDILPIMSKNISLCYNPYFIAMGTVAYDCTNPEFILLGNHDNEVIDIIKNFYNTICNTNYHITSLENAEMIKVCYNTFISSKIAMANTIMELCHNCPNTDCDDVIDALSKSNKRLISNAYLRGGMGDGGGCHPRDNIALSWLSNKVNMKFNWFDSIMIAREKQTEFLVDLILKEYDETKLPIIIYGYSFKPNTAIKTGSPAILLVNILKEKNINFITYDPVSEKYISFTLIKGIYFIGCAHDYIYKVQFPDDSIIIDPHRKFQTSIKKGKYIPVGKNY